MLTLTVRLSVRCIPNTHNPMTSQPSRGPNCNGNCKCSVSKCLYYLKYVLHEHLSETKNVEILITAASSSFGRIHSIFRPLANMGIKTYETLYQSYVDPIMNYVFGVWGFRHYDAPRCLQNRILRFFWGVNKFAPAVATKLEKNWMECREEVGVIRYIASCWHFQHFDLKITVKARGV